MAIEIEYLSIIIKDSSIKEKYKGGIDQFINDADYTHEEDGEIHGLSYMDPGDAEVYLNLLVKRGLTYQENKKSIDIAVCDVIAGIFGRCDWLTYERKPGNITTVKYSTEEKTDTLDGLLRYSSRNARICPTPVYWQGLWEKLKGKKRIGSGWGPSLPLILAAWEETSALDKKLRFIEHLSWADQQGQIKEIADYVYCMKEKQWVHQDD